MTLRKWPLFTIIISILIIVNSLLVALQIEVTNVKADRLDHTVGNVQFHDLSDFGRILFPIVKGTGQTVLDPISGLGLIGLVVDHDNYNHTPGAEDIADSFGTYPYDAPDDFTSVEPIRIIEDDGITQKSFASFQNTGMGTGDLFDILINQTAWTQTGKNWAIIQWSLYNQKSSQISGLCIGLELPLSKDGCSYGVGGDLWDGGDDIDGFDSINKTYWVSDYITGVTFGVASAIITDPITHYYGEDYHSDASSEYIYFFEDDAWLHSRLHKLNATATDGINPGNVTTTIGWNNETLNPGESRTHTLVIAINDTQNNMIKEISEAQEYFYIENNIEFVADAGPDQIVSVGQVVQFNGSGYLNPPFHKLTVNFATDSALYLRTVDPVGPGGGGWEGAVREWVNFSSQSPFWIAKKAGHLGQGTTGIEYTYYWKMHEEGIFNLSFRAANGNYYADIFDETNKTYIISGLYAQTSVGLIQVPAQLSKWHNYRLDIYDTIYFNPIHPNDLDVIFYINETEILLTPERESIVYFTSVDPFGLDCEGSGVTNITFYSRGIQEFYTYYISELNHSEVEISDGELLEAWDPYKTGITPSEYNDTDVEIAFNYTWDFDANVDSDGDGNYTNDADSYGKTPTHVYLNEGIYTVTVKVSGPLGLWDMDTCLVTVIDIAPPTLNINVSSDGNDSVLSWDHPLSLGIDHYLIYRSTSQTDFNFSMVWKNTSIDKEPGESAPIPLRTIWNDTNSANPDNQTNYAEQYYYTIRLVNSLGKISSTSRTVGKWTRSFPSGVSTFSLPFEPIVKKDTEFYCQDMNASYIKWMNQTTHTWMRHDKGSSVNNTMVKVGEGYEIGFLNKSFQTKYTFTGMPGAMIIYDNVPFGFDATPLTGNADNLTATVDSCGNVTLNWTQPVNIGSGDKYYVLRSSSRDGFCGTLGVNYNQLVALPYDVLSYQDIVNATPGTEYYYMIVPVNLSTGERGVSTYSIGVWTEEYLQGYDTFGIPLKLDCNQTADWYCDNIPDTVGINYYIYTEQRWCWHSTRMPAEAYDPILEMTEGYQISTSSFTKFTFIGI